MLRQNWGTNLSEEPYEIGSELSPIFLDIGVLCLFVLLYYIICLVSQVFEKL